MNSHIHIYILLNDKEKKERKLTSNKAYQIRIFLKSDIPNSKFYVYVTSNVTHLVKQN